MLDGDADRPHHDRHVDLNAKLALANGILSAASATCALLGWRAIRRRNVRAHRALMIAATASSGLFLALFVARFALFGFRPFHGHGVLRGVYLAVFFTHEPVSVVAVPLVVVALLLGLLSTPRAHREVATIAFPVWMYSLVTGALLYVLLYLLA